MRISSPPNVFINCPFDAKYLEMFRAVNFTVFCAGCIPRCTLENPDSGQQRIDRIISLINECPLGIHDLSRTELDRTHNLPRFNMPFELGFFMGAKHFGNPPNDAKRCLIMVSEPYTYKVFLSDLSGCDPVTHANTAEIMIARVLTWFNRVLDKRLDMSAREIYEMFKLFDLDFMKMCKMRKASFAKMPYEDYIEFTKNITDWLKDNLP